VIDADHSSTRFYGGTEISQGWSKFLGKPGQGEPYFRLINYPGRRRSAQKTTFDHA
jgi:hypothetical protein